MRHTSNITTTAVLLATLGLGSGVAFADDGRGHHARSADSRGNQQGHPVERAVPRPQGVPQRGAPPQAVAPNVERSYPAARGYSPGRAQPYVARPNAVAPYTSHSYNGHPYSYDVHPYTNHVHPYTVRPYVVAPYHAPYRTYAAPYYRGPYVFRPHFQLAFGISLGYPVPFYAYPYPMPVYGYAAPRTPVVVGPGSNQYGGVSLEVTPDDAAVYVDGGYAGLVRDFDGTRQPLTLSAGPHHIQVDAQGCAPWDFDVNVVPGQILPYRGELESAQ